MNCSYHKKRGGSIKAQRGGALAIALMSLIVATILGTVLLGGTGQKGAWTKRELQRIQALYLVESAVRLALFQSQGVTAQDSLPWGFLRAGAPELPEVVFDSAGYWLQAKSQIEYLGAMASLSASVGKKIDSVAFAPALRLTDPVPLEDQGSMRVRGVLLTGTDLTVPAHGAVQSALQAIPERIARPYRDSLRQWFDRTLLPWDHPWYLTGRQRIWDIDDLEDFKELRVEQGDLSLELQGPRATMAKLDLRTVAVQGDVFLSGVVRFDTLTIVAEGQVQFKGEWSGQLLRVYARQGIRIEGVLQARTELLAEGDIVLGREVQLTMPSMVATVGTPDAQRGQRGDIILKSGSSVNGWILAFANPPALPATGGAVPGAPVQGAGLQGVQVITESQSEVRGVLVSGGSVQHQGWLGGCMVTPRLSCAHRPGINCAAGGEIDRDSLPKGFAQPWFLDVGAAPHWQPIAWKIKS